MSHKVTRAAYIELIQEDIERLIREMPHSLERDHIAQIVAHSVGHYYPENPSRVSVTIHENVATFRDEVPPPETDRSRA